MTSATSEGGRRGPSARYGSGRSLRTRLTAAGRLVGVIPRGGPPPLAPPPRRERPSDTVETTVGDGETVSDVAERHGVSTASLLALNGLGWRTPVRTGQILLVRPTVRPVPPGADDDDLRRHRVLPGETLASIAERHGLATAALLLANGLSRSSVVRPGHRLVIPPASPRRITAAAVALSGEMRVNAHLVVDAGRGLGVPDDAIVVALAVAMEESALRNLAPDEHGVGVFQRRPDAGWGAEAALRDPFRAALAFYGGPGVRSGRAATGLLDVPGWQLMELGEAAAAVQGSSDASGYGRWEGCARAWLADLDRESGRR